MNKFITLTWDFIQNKDYSSNEKFIYCEILNLSQLNKGCVAQNEHFAAMLGVKKEAVSRLISSLENKGVITTKIKNGSRNFGRTITINKMLFDPKQNVISPLTKCLETKENNTINNTININVPKSFNGFKYPEAFENLWKIYNIGSKSNAYKSYVKIAEIRNNSIKLKSEYATALLEILEVENEKTEYQRHLSTILNQDILSEYEKIKSSREWK